MARCIPDVIPAAQHHDGEQALLERLRTELPDDFIVIPCLEVPFSKPVAFPRRTSSFYIPAVVWGPNTGSGRYT